MKRRNLKTYKLMVVALTAATGCAASVQTPPQAPVVAQTSSSTPASSTTSEVHAPTAVEPEGVPESSAALEVTPEQLAALKVLRTELTGPRPYTHSSNNVDSEVQRRAAFSNVAHFRPLCDKDGYPLVGNVQVGSKSSEPRGYQASVFCKELRKKGLR